MYSFKLFFRRPIYKKSIGLFNVYLFLLRKSIFNIFFSLLIWTLFFINVTHICQIKCKKKKKTILKEYNRTTAEFHEKSYIRKNISHLDHSYTCKAMFRVMNHPYVSGG